MLSACRCLPSYLPDLRQASTPGRIPPRAAAYPVAHNLTKPQTCSLFSLTCTGKRKYRGAAMAQIVLGLGTSHSPQLSTPPELWRNHGERDKRNPDLRKPDGRVYAYEEVLASAPLSI